MTDSEYTPVLPPHWKHVIGVVPIPPDDIRTWDEDIFSAQWRPDETLPRSEGWWIWLDGGKGLTPWQCSLVVPNPVAPDGTVEYMHDRLMRDFLHTTEEVQAWIDRAVVIAQKAQEQDEKEP
jgi:hypothetical protein